MSRAQAEQLFNQAQTLAQFEEAQQRKYREVNKQIQKLLLPHSQFQAQLEENKKVKSEFDLLDDDAVVYKLVGPVLVKQEIDEAKQNVEKRIEFISDNVTRKGKEIEALQKQQEETKNKIMASRERLRDLMMKMEQMKQANPQGQAPQIATQ